MEHNLRLLLLVDQLHSLKRSGVDSEVVAREFAYRHLALGYYVARLEQPLVLLQAELYVEHHVLLVLVVVELVGQHQLHLLVRRKHRDVGYCSVLILYTIGDYRPRQRYVLGLGEEVLVVYRDCACIQVDRLSPIVLIVVLHVPYLGVGNAVGIDESVAVEVVVRRVVRVIVASVLINHIALIVFTAQSLVDKVPDESALEMRILACKVPVLLHHTARIAHSVSILA